MPEKILVVDDEPLIRWTLGEAMREWNFVPIEAATSASALNLYKSEQPVVTLLDINLPDGSGLELLREIKRLNKEAVVIMITANILIDDTISALRAGAYDFISKPLNLDQMQVSIRNAIEARELRRELTQIRQEQSRPFSFLQIIGDSKPMKDLIALARKVAASDVSSVLLQGESGTGKDLVAKAIHYSTPFRVNKPFVAINCAVIPATLIESEIFGYEKGAFTDAKQRKQGLFEQAEGGTLFLDEIGELGLGLQAKLLRVFEEGSFRRVGGLKDIPLNVRVIAASNRDLKAESDAGTFRRDLYYRLSVVQIDFPPLRERGEDVLLLADYFIKSLDRSWGGKTPRKLSQEAAQAFLRYHWTGNVRELRNAVERALILEDEAEISTKYLPRGLSGELDVSGFDAEFIKLPKEINLYLPPEGISLDKVEAALIRLALERKNGNITQAGKLLGVSRDRIRYFLKKQKNKS